MGSFYNKSNGIHYPDPTKSHICQIYNSFWGFTTGSNMTFRGDTFIITGPVNRFTANFWNSPMVYGVDVTRSGYNNLSSFLHTVGLVVVDTTPTHVVLTFPNPQDLMMAAPQ